MGRNMHDLTNFWTWVKKTFTPSYQSEIEDYLKDSVDHKDLESRIATLQRRGLI